MDINTMVKIGWKTCVVGQTVLMECWMMRKKYVKENDVDETCPRSRAYMHD